MNPAPDPSITEQLTRLANELGQLKSSNPEAYGKLLDVLDKQTKKLNTLLAETLAGL